MARTEVVGSAYGRTAEGENAFSCPVPARLLLSFSYLLPERGVINLSKRTVENIAMTLAVVLFSLVVGLMGVAFKHTDDGWDILWISILGLAMHLGITYLAVLVMRRDWRDKNG